MPGENGWPEWGKYVLKELERLNECYTGLKREVTEIQVQLGRISENTRGINGVKEDVTSLKVKAGVWGLVGGAIPILIALLLKIVHV
jgi:hypothetical protein